MAILRFLCYLLLVRPSFVNPCSDHNQPTGRRPTRWRSCENFVAARKFAQVAVQRNTVSAFLCVLCSSSPVDDSLYSCDSCHSWLSFSCRRALHADSQRSRKTQESAGMIRQFVPHFSISDFSVFSFRLSVFVWFVSFVVPRVEEIRISRPGTPGRYATLLVMCRSPSVRHCDV